MATTDIVGKAMDAEQARQEVIKTQDMSTPRFWCPKRSMIGSLPKGVRGWSVFERKPELAQIVYDPKLLDKIGVVRLRERDHYLAADRVRHRHREIAHRIGGGLTD